MEAAIPMGIGEILEEEAKPDLRVVAEVLVDDSNIEAIGAVVATNSVELTLVEEDDDMEVWDSVPRRGSGWTLSDDVMLKAKTGKTRQRWC
jgi:hypothetical protein